jgi:hypothetical protein
MHLVIVFVWACRRKLRDVGLHSRHLGLSLLSGILITVIGPVVSYTAEFVVQLPKQPVLHSEAIDLKAGVTGGFLFSEQHRAKLAAHHDRRWVG